MTTSKPEPPALADDDQALILEATRRADLADALLWISEGRSLAAGTPARLLKALVGAADAALPHADAALRVVTREALQSTLDTSADLISTDMITPPTRYHAALAEVAKRTPTGSLADITPQAVGSAQAANSLVIETLALVAGLSWRDLRDRSRSRGITLPSKATSPWSSSQTKSAFDIIDEIVTGRVESQLVGTVAARPVELLLGDLTTWTAIDQLFRAGVSYGTLLAQRDVGSAWSAHRNRTNSEISRLVVLEVLAALDGAEVSYWSTDGPRPVQQSFLAKQVKSSGAYPGQLSVVTRTSNNVVTYAIFIAVARDGGTARKTAATLLQLPEVLSVPAVLVLAGTGWADRSESDKLVRAFGGRIYTEKTLKELASMAAERTIPSGAPHAPKLAEEHP